MRRISSRALWIAWLALAAVGVAEAALAARLDYFPLDIRIALAWQDAAPAALEPLLIVLNRFDLQARVAVTAALLVYGLAAPGRRWAAWFIVVPFAAQPLNAVIKLIVARPRPLDSLIRVTDHDAGFSFPSGHVMHSVLVFGFLYVACDDLIDSRPLRTAVRAACVLTIVLMGPARVYTGAHWPSDVVGGYVFGALVLLPVLWLYGRLRRAATGRGAAGPTTP